MPLEMHIILTVSKNRQFIYYAHISVTQIELELMRGSEQFIEKLDEFSYSEIYTFAK